MIYITGDVMKLKKWLKNNYNLLIIFITIIIFLMFLWNVVSVEIMEEDTLIYNLSQNTS